MNNPGGYQRPTAQMLSNIGHVRHPADHGHALYHATNRAKLLAHVTGVSTSMEGAPANTLNQWG